MATHLSELVREHADELLTREEVNRLLEQLKSQAPKLVEESVPGVIKPGELQKILQALLRERVPIRDLETILETVSDWAAHTKDPDVLTEYARNALRRTISGMYAQRDEETGKETIHCVTMDPATEDVISGYIERSPAGTTLTMPPDVASGMAKAIASAAEPLVAAGHQLVILASPAVRGAVRQIVDGRLSGAVVLGYNEIVKEVDVESYGLVEHEPRPSRDRTTAPASADTQEVGMV